MSSSRDPRQGSSDDAPRRSGPRVRDVARRAGVAIGTDIQAATDLDIRVPDDLLVIGYDDDHFTSESSIPVSTVSQPRHRIGELAVELLIEEIRQPSGHIHRTETLDPHVIPRRSTLRSREDTSKSKGIHVAHMVRTAHIP